MRREGESFLCLGQQFLIVVTEARAKATEGIGCTKDDGEAQSVSGLLYFLNGIASFALDGLHANLVKTLDKEVAVFGIDDCLNGCAKDFDTIFLEYTFPVKLHAHSSKLSVRRSSAGCRPAAPFL